MWNKMPRLLKNLLVVLMIVTMVTTLSPMSAFADDINPGTTPDVQGEPLNDDAASDEIIPPEGGGAQEPEGDPTLNLPDPTAGEPQNGTTPLSEAAQAVQNSIDNLPTVEEVEKMTAGQQSDVFTQAVKIRDAYRALSEEEQEAVNADSLFDLIEYFNSKQGSIPELLAGDNARISNFQMMADDRTESGDAMRTGTSPWDNDNEPGNDKNDLNNVVRTYDSVLYTIEWGTALNKDATNKGIQGYESGTVYFEYILPVSKDNAIFDVGSMGWLNANQQIEYEIADVTINGKDCQVLRGSFLSIPSSDNPAAIGNSYNSQNVAIQILNMHNGDTLQPVYTLWLKDNDVGTTYSEGRFGGIPQSIVTGSGHKCAVHDECEYMTVETMPVQISAAPRYNIKFIKTSGNNDMPVGNYDFTTGNDNAMNKDLGSVYGRIYQYSANLQIVGKKGYGLKGIEIPDTNEAITFDITMSSEFKGIKPEEPATPAEPEEGEDGDDEDEPGTPVDPDDSDGGSTGETPDDEDGNGDVGYTGKTYNSKTDGNAYLPLFWSGDANRYSNATTSAFDKRQPTTTSGASASHKYAQHTPYNSGDGGNRCPDGGTWTFAADENDPSVIHVTVSGFKIDLPNSPNCNSGVSSSKVATTATYYSPSKVGDRFWLIETACFSTGKMYVIQPYVNMDETSDFYGKKITQDLGSGTVVTTLWENNMRIVSETGKVVTNQTTYSATDDSGTYDNPVTKPGTYGVQVQYSEYTLGYNHPVSSGAWKANSDWIAAGNNVSIWVDTAASGAQGERMVIAADAIAKFDDKFFYPTKCTSSDSSSLGLGNFSKSIKIIWGAKPDKTGWNHKGLMPDQPGYDDEMMTTPGKDLLWFDSLEDLRAQGYVCVAACEEWRGLNSYSDGGQNEHKMIVCGKVNSDCPVNYTYMVVGEGHMWNAGQIPSITDLGDKDLADLTNIEICDIAKTCIPSLLMKDQPDYVQPAFSKDYATNSGYQTAKKATYPNGEYKAGSGSNTYIDTCLVVPYESRISKAVAQINDDGTSKSTYDLSVNQRVVDYMLEPSITKTINALDSTGERFTTTATITDTLPKGLTYIDGTSYWDKDGTATYTQGKRQQTKGTVEGAQKLEPDVTYNNDGTTTLVWTLKDVEFGVNDVTSLGLIYFSASIGTPGNEQTDVKHQQELINKVTIQTTEDNIRDLKLANGNLANVSIHVEKMSAASLVKTSDHQVVDAGRDMGFTLNMGNNSNRPMDIILVDALPYDGDAAGSDFNGELYVSELSAANDNDDLYKSFRYFYTTDQSYRGMKSSDFFFQQYDVNTFDASGDWTELTVSDAPQQGLFTNLPAVEAQTGDNQIVAIVAVGTLPGEQTMKMHLTCELPDTQPGDIVFNSLSQRDMDSVPPTSVVNRMLSGLTWHDVNRDGIRDANEELIPSGVKISLMKLNDNGEYEVYKYTDQAGVERDAVIETGQQLNVLDGTLSDYQASNYLFTCLPEGTFGVKFENGTTKIEDYSATKTDQGSDDSVDSDSTPTYNGTKLAETNIEGIVMPPASQIKSGTTYKSRYHDSGFYYFGASVEKVWDDADDQDGKREESVDVTLMADGEEYETVSLDDNNSWKHVFNRIPEFNNGEKIEYTIEEQNVPTDYDPVFSDPADAPIGIEFTVTNVHPPETVDIPVSKVWDDADLSDVEGYVRPESVTIHLLADGEEIEEVVLTDADIDNDGNWTQTFEGLPKYNNGQIIEYTTTEDTVSGYTGSSDGTTVTNKPKTDETIDPVALQIQKTEAETSVSLPGAVFQLTKDGENYATLSATGDNGTVSYTFTEAGTYYLSEMTAPDGYVKGDDTYKIVVTDAGIDRILLQGDIWMAFKHLIFGNETDHGLLDNKGTLTVDNTPDVTEVYAKKVWDDAYDGTDNYDKIRPDSIQMQLYKQVGDGEVEAVDGSVVTLDGTADADGEVEAWTAAFTNLPIRERGQEVTYTVDEVEVPTYYTKGDITGDGTVDSPFVITNVHKPEFVDKNGSKTWKDNGNQAGDRPESIKISLIKDGSTVVDTKTVTAADKWKWSFTGLDKYEYAADGQSRTEIVYTISEEKVPGYGDPIYDGNDVINPHDTIPPTRGFLDVVGQKTWEFDSPEDRPESITVNLFADGKKIASTEVTAADDWTYSFTRLPEKTESGKKINYTVVEVGIENYVAKYDGNDIVNEHNPGFTSVTVMKAWEDAENNDGKRPEAIKVQLYRDGETVGSPVELNDNNDWRYTFEDLPVNSRAMVPAGTSDDLFVYTVEEVGVPAGYTSVVTGDAAEGFVITNTHEPEVTDINGCKTWADYNNAAGLRPGSITIRLLADGAEIDSKVVTAVDNWAWSFEKLPVYKNGAKINYTILEDEVEGYTTEIDGYNVTNTVIPGDDEPKTGDHMPVVPLAGAAIAALLGMALTFRRRTN